MGEYEEKQRKEREALDAKFRAASAPLAAKLIAEIAKATGVTPKQSVQEGSYAITLSIEEPRITIEIQHDWGTGHRGHWSLPLGTPKIRFNHHGYGRGNTSWYRPGKDGEFNLQKIVKTIADDVKGYKIQQKSQKEGKIKAAENEAAQAEELKGIKLPDGVVVQRNYGPDSYTFRFGGTFSGLNVFAVQDLAESFKKLIEQYKFEKSWRMDY